MGEGGTPRVLGDLSHNVQHCEELPLCYLTVYTQSIAEGEWCYMKQLVPIVLTVQG